jgi:putative ABC transport system substrate-binding protein
MELQFYEVGNSNEFDAQFAAMRRNHVDAVIIVADSFFGYSRQRLGDLASNNRLPTMYGLREHMDAGGS